MTYRRPARRGRSNRSSGTARVVCSMLYALITLPLWTGSAQGQENAPPRVQLVRATPFVADQTTITYVLYDADDDVDGQLRYALYFYPDERLSSVGDIRVFATKIADQQDALLEVGERDLLESQGPEDAQTYVWDDTPLALRNRGFAPATKVLPGRYYLYLTASDGINAPVFAVSDFYIQVARGDAPTLLEAVGWSAIKRHTR